MAYGAVLGQKPNNTTYTNTQILNPSDATLIGLNSNALPADMFNVLSHVGDLHVWQRTVTVVDKIPAGYNLGAEQSNIVLVSGTESGRTAVSIRYGDSISVDDAGTITMNSPTNKAIYHAQTTSLPSLSGKYVMISDFPYSQNTSQYKIGTVFYIPSGGYISRASNITITLSKAQIVTSYPATPAGTTVDYPVSTNRNAYTEGTSAGTTIEYLGNLGDKARIISGSYVGSGTNTVKIPSEKNVKAVIVDGYHERDSFSFIYVSYPTTKSIGIRFENNNAVNSEITISWGNQITIKDNMDGYYLNNSGKQYFYKLIL